MIEKIYRNGYEFQIDRERPFLRFKGNPKKPPAPPAPSPTKYTAEADAAKRDIMERNKAGRGRAASIVSAPGLGSIMPNLELPKLKSTLG